MKLLAKNGPNKQESKEKPPGFLEFLGWIGKNSAGAVSVGALAGNKPRKP